MDRLDIARLYKDYKKFESKTVSICGWVKTTRNSKNILFIEINDGSTLKNVQLVAINGETKDFFNILKLNVGSAVRVSGVLVLTNKESQPFEIKISEVIVEGESRLFVR